MKHSCCTKENRNRTWDSRDGCPTTVGGNNLDISRTGVSPVRMVIFG
ncbi:MAG: hypothetical protein AB1480_03595 [Nitrospirota bacterium]